MHKFFTPKELINGDVAKILGDDVKHIYKVLRIAEGEKVVLNNCEGLEYLAKVTDVNKQEVSLEIIEKLDLNNESEIKVFLFQGLPKAQKMDLIVQKGTELGITEFIPTCRRFRTDPAHPALGFMEPMITRRIRDCTIAPAHIWHGSNVT